MRGPIVLITVHRRYHELALAVDRVWEAFVLGEFLWPPEVWVVWACTEPGRVWFLQGLVDAGMVARVLSRPALPGEGEGHATTHPESRNIRLGLERVAALPDPPPYVVVQAADVLPHFGTFAFLDQRVLVEGDRAVLFFFDNGCVQRDIWHTNFFAVPPDPAYWPPLAEPGDQDVLERLWGLRLAEARPPGLCTTHNYGGRRFAHDHLTEHYPLFPEEPLPLSASVPLGVPAVRGIHPLRRLCRWPRSSASSTPRPSSSPS